MGIVVDYYCIIGKGFRSYFKHIFLLKKLLSNNSYNIVHAHYSLSGYVASLAGAKPLIVSLMGSDVKANWFSSRLIYFFHKFFWSKTVIKSIDMQKSLGFNKLEIIPNGVDLSIFKPMDKYLCRGKLGWAKEKCHILFLANPLRYEKNYALTERSIEILKLVVPAELHKLEDLPHCDIPYHINGADVVILSSLWEGSPNVIKESMACNCPIVTTNVGDIKWVIGETPGCYITSFDPNDISDKIKSAITFAEKSGRTNGRERIITIGLDSNSVARKIIDIYMDVLK